VVPVTHWVASFGQVVTVVLAHWVATDEQAVNCRVGHSV